MTERPLSITTQIATPIQATFNSAVSIATNDALPVAESVDEEPYTIKCICDYSDDDGNTIYCETCDTWQHIECFYPGRVADAAKADFAHSCADCKPRPLDRRHATERQRQQRQNKVANETGDKKTKRPPSKSHKKKPKPSELQVNGHNDHDGHKSGSPHDQQSYSKKSKGHRSNHSINAQAKRSPPLNGRPNTQNHPPSPAHTPPDLPPDFQVHSYSDSFLKLYDGDEDFQTTPTNSFATLSVTNSMSSWLRDPESLQKDTGIADKNEVFQFLKLPFHSLKWPELVVKPKHGTSNDMSLFWKCLITPASLSQTGRIAELNGLVGFQKVYCDDMENKWVDTAHPRPFIFFHPRLPLFIDTRREGSICRYVRRSCRANTSLETFIASGSEYHFWLVSERPLAANEQITLPWDFRFPVHLRSRYLHLLNLGDDDGTPFDGTGMTDEEYDQLTSTINLVLSDHGGCACDLENDCAFARFHRNYQGRSQIQTNGMKSKKGRKPKQSHVSPTSTGHATNSRAASEGQQDNGDEDDTRSVSGSSRSKPQSRDLTPLHGLGDTNGGTVEHSDREKRKIAMVEENFRKLEQGQPPRKKKRASDGSNVNTANSTSIQPASRPRQRSVAPRTSISQKPATASSIPRGRNYVDSSTSRRQSGSPFSALSPTAAVPTSDNNGRSNESARQRSRQASTTPKPTYATASTQTENEIENAWWKAPKSKTKRTVVPLAKRLLKNRSRIQSQQETRAIEQAGATKALEDLPPQLSPTLPMDLDPPNQEGLLTLLDSPTDSRDRHVSIASSTPSVDAASSLIDVTMNDVPAIIIGNTIKPPPPPWPGHPTNITGLPSSGPRSPELRVQMPPTPTFTTPNMSGPLSGPATPSSAAGSIAQSPFGTVHFPSGFPPTVVNGIGQHASPIKTTKKLSLSDYKASRMKRNDTSANTNKQLGGSSPTAPSVVLKPSLSTIEETKANGLLEGSTIIDSPFLEKSVDHLASAIGVASDLALKNNLPSEQTNGTL